MDAEVIYYADQSNKTSLGKVLCSTDTKRKPTTVGPVTVSLLRNGQPSKLSPRRTKKRKY